MIIKNFALIGDGTIARWHKQAINSLGYNLVKIYDPVKYPAVLLDDKFFEGVEWVTICSPSHLHYDHVKLCLDHNKNIICEKPLCLPWQPIIDDDRINIVLQYRWADLPKEIKEVEVCMVRDKAYFESWKGDPFQTGGLFYNLFIHYLDLAILHGSTFIGSVTESGTNVRRADDIDLFSFDMGELYTKMYKDTVEYGRGVKAKDTYYLMWSLNRNSEIYGFGSNALNKKIVIEKIIK